MLEGQPRSVTILQQGPARSMGDQAWTKARRRRKRGARQTPPPPPPPPPPARYGPVEGLTPRQFELWICGSIDGRTSNVRRSTLNRCPNLCYREIQKYPIATQDFINYAIWCRALVLQRMSLLMTCRYIATFLMGRIEQVALQLFRDCSESVRSWMSSNHLKLIP